MHACKRACARARAFAVCPLPKPSSSSQVHCEPVASVLPLSAAEAPTYETKIHMDIDLERFIPHHQDVEWMVDTAPDDRSWEAELRVDVGPADPVDYNVWCSADLVNDLFAAKVRQAARGCLTCAADVYSSWPA